VNRVRGTTEGTHPPPEERTALLRGIFEPRGLLHFAEAWVSSLLLREATIVARARASGLQVGPEQGEVGG
jgi:hypothetical protein